MIHRVNKLLLVTLLLLATNLYAHRHPPVSHEHSMGHDHDGFGTHSHRFTHAAHNRHQRHSTDFMLKVMGHDLIAHSHTHPHTHSHSGIGTHTHDAEHSHVPGGGEHPFFFNDINHSKDELNAIDTGIPIGAESGPVRHIRRVISEPTNVVTSEVVKPKEVDVDRAYRVRLVLVITEVHIEDGSITFIKACSNYPNQHIMGRLRQRAVEIPVESRIYEKPVWADGAWVETCKEFEVDIPMTQLLLIADGNTSVDVFDTELSSGVWYRQYERLENRFLYPYFNVENDWYQLPSAPTRPRHQKLVGTWATLKQR